MSITIPIKISDTEIDLFIALDDQSIERIKEYDPIEFRQDMLPKSYVDMYIRTIGIGYANADDIDKLTELAKAGDLAGMLKYLSRGWKYKPEAGDNDEKYTSMTKG